MDLFSSFHAHTYHFYVLFAQRVVEILSLLEDPSYTGGEAREVEVAIRIKGCGRQKTFGLTHVYWS